MENNDFAFQWVSAMQAVVFESVHRLPRRFVYCSQIALVLQGRITCKEYTTLSDSALLDSI